MVKTNSYKIVRFDGHGLGHDLRRNDPRQKMQDQKSACGASSAELEKERGREMENAVFPTTPPALAATSVSQVWTRNAGSWETRKSGVDLVPQPAAPIRRDENLRILQKFRTL